MTFLTSLLAAAAITVNVEPNAKGHDVPDSLWGIFFEDSRVRFVVLTRLWLMRRSRSCTRLSLKR